MRKALRYAPWALVLILVIATSSAQHQYHKLNDQIADMKASGLQEKPQIDYVNAIRAKHGVAPLKYDDGLIKSADARTADMVARDYWSHIDPDGKPFYDTVIRVRPGLQLMGENIGQCFTTYEQLYTTYEQSPSHLEAIVNPKFTLFGGSTQWDDTKFCFVNANEFGA